MQSAKRQIYFQFAHQAIPEIFFNAPEKFFEALRTHGSAFMQYVWMKLEKLSQKGETSLADQLRVEHSKHGKTNLFLLVLPQAQDSGETLALLFADLCSEEGLNKHLMFSLDIRSTATGTLIWAINVWENENIHRRLGEFTPDEINFSNFVLNYLNQ